MAKEGAQTSETRLFKKFSELVSAPAQPWVDLALQQEVEDAIPPNVGTVAGWSPAVEMSETEQEFNVRAELPGIKPEDIEVSIMDNALVLSGEKKEKTEKGKQESARSLSSLSVVLLLHIF